MPYCRMIHVKYRKCAPHFVTTSIQARIFHKSKKLLLLCAQQIVFESHILSNIFGSNGHYVLIEFETKVIKKQCGQHINDYAHNVQYINVYMHCMVMHNIW